MKKERYYISFYPDKEAQGGALRENLVIDSANFDVVLRKAKIVGEKLRAKSFIIFQPKMPRIWLTGYEEID